MMMNDRGLIYREWTVTNDVRAFNKQFNNLTILDIRCNAR